MNYQGLLIPPCLRDDAAGNPLSLKLTLDNCVLGSITYYIELLLILVGIMSFIYIVYAGIQMATGFGNEAKYTAGKNTLLHAIMGLIIATLAYTIVSFTMGLFGAKEGLKLYDSGTGDEFSNDEAKVTSKIVALKIAQDPTNPDELTDPEREEAESGSGSGSSLALTGKKVMILMINDEPFSATIQGTPLTVHFDAKTKKYWVKAWDDTARLKGANIVITQGKHSRTVTLEVP